MKNKNRELAAELAVGALVALIFAGLAVFTIAISGKNLFRKNVFQIETVMPDAMGLRPNDPVIAKGTTVGSVTKVFYDRDGVHVQAQLEAPVEFHEGYEITVVSTSILGGRQLVLKEGDETSPVVEETVSEQSTPFTVTFDPGRTVIRMALMVVATSVRVASGDSRVMGLSGMKMV